MKIRELTGKHGFDLVNRREGQADQVLAGAEPAVAHLVKGVFEVVRKRGEGVKPEHRPGSGKPMLCGFMSAGCRRVRRHCSIISWCFPSKD